MSEATKNQKRSPDPGMLDVVWAIVLIQGAITLLTTLEATIGSFALGSISIAGPVIGLSFGGGVLALVSARGLRLRRQWARRVTVVAEYLVLGSGVLALVASLILAQSLPGLVTLTVTLVAPLMVLVLLRRNRVLFQTNPGVVA